MILARGPAGSCTASRPNGSPLNRFLEILILLAVCFLTFFVNLHRHRYIETEGLRAVVVEEMLPREGFTMPTVHQAPYLNKPPLYAWTTTALARCAGRFDEQIARLPSAVCGTLFVLLMYFLGERWIGRGGGLPAAVFALLSPTVEDYAVRAELDLPFGFFCTACMALALTALRNAGARGAVFWISAYFFGLIASMWKGPHCLVFMWLTMIGYSRLTRDWSFLRAPAQWIGLAGTLAVLFWWADALSAFAGAANVRRAAGIELLARLAPWRGDHFLSILTFPAFLFLITVPSSALASLSIRSSVRTAAGLTARDLVASGTAFDRFKQRFAEWWTSMKAHPLGLRVCAWLVPNLIFMTVAPAKSPRYAIPVFAPIFLMGGWIVLSLDAARSTDAGRYATRVWRRFFGILALIGTIALARVAAGIADWDLPIGRAQNWQPGLILGLGCVIPLICDLTRRGGRSLRARLLVILLTLLCAQPALHGVVWLRRAAGDSQREVCGRIDALVPEGQRLYVLGQHEYPDTQIYSRRCFQFVESIDAALARCGADRACAILRADEVEELTAGAGASYAVVFEFELADKRNLFIEITTGQVNKGALEQPEEGA